MAQNFDDILKKGKEKAGASATKNKKELFREYVVNLLSLIHNFNDIFDNDQHNVMISNANCDKCRKPTFIITVKNIDNMKQAIRFHRSNWKAAGQGVYHCEKCKKG